MIDKFRTFLILSLLLVIGSCSVQPLEVGEIKNVKFLGLNNDTLTFQVAMPIKNPNGIRFKITDIQVKILMDQEKVGDISKIYDIKVAPRSHSVHRIKFQMMLPDKISGGLYLFRMMTQRKLNAQLKGTITGKAFLIKKTVMIDERISLDLLKKRKRKKQSN